MRDIIGKCCRFGLLWLACSSFDPALGAADNRGASTWSIDSALEQLSIDGEWNEDQARIMIQAVLKGLDRDTDRVIVATSVRQAIQVSRDQVRQQIALRLDALQGQLKETALALTGEGVIREVTGAGLRAWSLRQETDGARSLVLRFEDGPEPRRSFSGMVRIETPVPALPSRVVPLTLTPEPAALFHGYVRVDVDAALTAEPTEATGLIGIDRKYLPVDFLALADTAAEPLAYRFQGTGYALPLKISVGDPEARRVVLNDFTLRGTLSAGRAAFVLSATARVRDPKGGRLELLAGGVALTKLGPQTDWRLALDEGRYLFECDRAGEYAIELEFNAAVRERDGWQTTDFKVAPSAVQPLVLTGLGAETQFQFPGAARPEWTGAGFASHLPADGGVRLAWKEARPEAEGRLFYAVEALSQVSVGPGLMRQVSWLEFKVMQGEVDRVVFLLAGEGEVTRVLGPQVLAWTVEADSPSGGRRLVVQLNQPQKGSFPMEVQLQAALGAFPQTLAALRLQPEGATRFGGYVRVVNDGAVRLEVIAAEGLSQISPDQFPVNTVTQSRFAAAGTQQFAYRFAGAAFDLRVRADNILPELGVSGLLVYRLGETELAIDAEFELEIREAPLRELHLRVPRDYAIARLTASGLSDYFVTDASEPDWSQLRLVYGTPVEGRQVVQLRLERNRPFEGAVWGLPRIEIDKARSVRGHVGVVAEAGYRLTPTLTEGLADLATAFFPKKVEGLQAAFRVRDPNWEATLGIERLPQSIQADGFHLFSIGEGIAYGSSVINYLIAGAPVSVFELELSPEYFNVEFTGKEVRNWQKTGTGFQVQLHTPVAGAYTLLATYERPFRSQGETLTFTGARPRDAQSEQGHTLVISSYQFEVRPDHVSTNLLRLEPAEVPAEYRLFFDAPILAAYRYANRPFTLDLALHPLTQGETVGQVIDRARLTTRVSKEGQVLTDARYFVKNKGSPHLRVIIPESLQLWSVTVNGTTVVPVTTTNRVNLIPLPQQGDPNTVQELELKLASRSPNPRDLLLEAPVLAAPVLLAEWNLEPELGRRLLFRGGSLNPATAAADDSGFAGMLRLFGGFAGPGAGVKLGSSLALALLALLVWRWAARERERNARFWSGAAVGSLAGLMALIGWVQLIDLAGAAEVMPARELSFVAPVQQPGSALVLRVANVPVDRSWIAGLGMAWPCLLGLALWIYTALRAPKGFRTLGWIGGWVCLCWGMLRWPNGAPACFALVLAFLVIHVMFPAWRQLLALPRQAARAGGASTALVWLSAGLALGAATARAGEVPAASSPGAAVLADAVVQEIHIERENVFATARIRWNAAKNQVLPILREPAVITRMELDPAGLKLVRLPDDPAPGYGLVALADGRFEAIVHYEARVIEREGESGFALPTQFGLINEARLVLAGLDMEIQSPQAVAVDPDPAGQTDTTARLVLAPVPDTWITWKPRRRDTRRERAVFYAEWAQLYVPAAGVIEGAHRLQIRPAQGELEEMSFVVPEGSTITDVTAQSFEGAPNSGSGPVRIAFWRFDPDERRLRVGVAPAQPRPFALLIHSQIAAGPLPFDLPVGVLSLNGAAGEVGMLGIATGAEVQLDQVTAEGFAPINLEDFPAGPAFGQPAGLTLRRAYRYTDARQTCNVRAAAVESDVRVEAQQTLSLGEDRVLLAASLNVEISRAGVFKLSFALPPGFDVESISGPALSHWTELGEGGDRVVTLHLKGKTEGPQVFAVSLAGPGLRATSGWPVPRLVLLEAAKQRGQLLIVPERGMRLRIDHREGVTQLDPERAGVREKGILAFRLLHEGWRLTVDVEQVDAWIQVASLQDVTLTDAQIKVAANLQYQIENTSVKSLRVSLPSAAEGVQFRGEDVADFLPAEDPTAAGAGRVWEIRLHRRIIGARLLQVTYHLPAPEREPRVELGAVRALDVNLQRGFVTVRTSGRLQAHVPSPPEELQPTEWQVIPRALQQDLPSLPANLTYRLVAPEFQLSIEVQRHEAARLLPARVNRVELTSVIADNGAMLTRVQLELVPGDKRLLEIGLPRDAHFWFAFVNRNSVWPWLGDERVLLPLEQRSQTAEATAVEFFFTSRVGASRGRSLDLTLLGPRFDLPLENISWRVYLSPKWELEDWGGTLELRGQEIADLTAADLDTYLRNEGQIQQQQTQQAVDLLSMANTLLQRGDPSQARRAFQAAYGLSQHDEAFNEDARVQLHNLKLQQALVGLNYRQAAIAGEPIAPTEQLSAPSAGREPVYTQDQARRILSRNSAEDIEFQNRLVERLIQQQDAAGASPAAIRATIPEQGRLLIFARSLQVDPWVDLRVELETRTARAASVPAKFGLLAALFVVMAALALLARRPVKAAA
ncbi:MAG: hypothetical protein KJ072_13825 [Verrucomicrobia bacterium]|nr:hypothetical protein [Verrucomicrobiota bacterium]